MNWALFYWGLWKKGEAFYQEFVDWKLLEKWKIRFWIWTSTNNGPVGNLVGGSFSEDLDDGGLRKWSFSLHGCFVRGTWRKSSFNRDYEWYVEKGSCIGHLSPKSFVDELGEGARLQETLRDQRRGVWKRSFLLYGSSGKGTWRETSLLVTLKSMQIKVLEKSISVHSSRAGGPCSRGTFT